MAMKCRSNYILQGYKNSWPNPNLENNSDTNANPKITKRYVRFRPNETLRDVYLACIQLFAIVDTS